METQISDFKDYDYWQYRVELASGLLKKFNGNHAKVLVYIDEHCPGVSLAEIDKLMDKMEALDRRLNGEE